MFESYLTKNLKEGEDVIRVVRRYPWSFAGQGIIALLFLLLPFFLLFPLLRIGTFGVVGLLALFLIGFFLVVRVMILYWLNVFVITNSRLVDFDQRGFFDRVVSESTYEKIQDVSFSVKGIAQTVLGYGTVQIQTAGSQANLEIRNVRNPEDVQHTIMRALADSLAEGKENTDLSADELVKLVTRLKHGLGEERFRAIVNEAETASRGKDRPRRKSEVRG